MLEVYGNEDAGASTYYYSENGVTKKEKFNESLLSVDESSTPEETQQQHHVEVNEGQNSGKRKHKRQAWGSQISFILASVGASIGFGNFLRFPSVLYRSGGGAFLIPFFIAFITIGFPLLLAELALGQRTQRGPIFAYQSIYKRAGGVGAAAVLATLFIVSYYVLFIDWMFVYAFHTFRIELPWINNAESFFYDTVLQRSSGILDFAGISWPVFIGHILTWICIYLCVCLGTKSTGIISFVTVPLPFILVAIFLVRGLFLEGAWTGIQYYVQPNFSLLLNPSVWISAFGQIMFSLSIGSGIMTAMASFTKKGQDMVRDNLFISISDVGFTLYSGFAVFALLGHLSNKTGRDISEVTNSGIALAFITFPDVIGYLPIPHLFAFMLWITLFTLGIDSAFAMLETISSVFHDWFPRVPIPLLNLLLCFFCFLMGVPYTLRNGLYLMNVVDHYVGDYCILIVAIFECIVFGYLAAKESLSSKLQEKNPSQNPILHFLKVSVFHSIEDFRQDIKKRSRFGPFLDFNIWVKFFAPIALAIVLINGFIAEIREKASSEDVDFVAIVIGLGIILLTFSLIIGFFVFPVCQDRAKRVETNQDDDDDDDGDGVEMSDKEKGFNKVSNDELKVPLTDSHQEQESEEKNLLVGYEEQEITDGDDYRMDEMGQK